jgi:hypothetical protein
MPCRRLDDCRFTHRLSLRLTLLRPIVTSDCVVALQRAVTEC